MNLIIFVCLKLSLLTIDANFSRHVSILIFTLLVECTIVFMLKGLQKLENNCRRMVRINVVSCPGLCRILQFPLWKLHQFAIITQYNKGKLLLQ